MNNLFYKIHGSECLSRIISEINVFNDTKIHVIKNQDPINADDIIINVFYFEELSKKKINFFFKQKKPTICIFKNNAFNLKQLGELGNFFVLLPAPIDLIDFFKISNILKIKFIFFNQANLEISKDMFLNVNLKLLFSKKKKIRLTEKDIQLILFLKEEGSSHKDKILQSVWGHKNELDSHAFDTQLHRLRKKIYENFGEKNFIEERNSIYSIKNSF